MDDLSTYIERLEQARQAVTDAVQQRREWLAAMQLVELTDEDQAVTTKLTEAIAARLEELDRAEREYLEACRPAVDLSVPEPPAGALGDTIRGLRIVARKLATNKVALEYVGMESHPRRWQEFAALPEKHREWCLEARELASQYLRQTGRSTLSRNFHLKSEFRTLWKRMYHGALLKIEDL
jgi:hypothetical protein